MKYKAKQSFSLFDGYGGTYFEIEIGGVITLIGQTKTTINPEYYILYNDRAYNLTQSEFNLFSPLDEFRDSLIDSIL